MSGQLYIVATPIGNLQDITFRAVDVLKSVDLIAAEDTRHSQRLLQALDIRAPLTTLHDHNEQDKSQHLIELLQEGKKIALISDAGTPLINDPGYRLVHDARVANILVTPIPGPCALITALSAAGLPTDRFCFEGFLPAKSTARKQILEKLKNEDATCIFYEAPHRILDSVEDIIVTLGEDRFIVLAKELTKTFETFTSGKASEVLAWLKSKAEHQLGEFVLLIKGAENNLDDNLARALQTYHLLANELSMKSAVYFAAEIHGVKKNLLYQTVLAQEKTTS